MSKKKINNIAPQPKKKKSKIIIMWDAPLVVDMVILCILAVAFIGGGLFLYFYDLSFLADTAKEVGEFFSTPANVDSWLKPFCAPLIISGLSILLFFAYRFLEHRDNPKWLKALLNLIYLGLVAGILYFNWYNCEAWFNAAAGPDDVMGQVSRYIMWANSVSCGVFFFLYYAVLVYVRDWSKPWDIVMTIFMMTILPAVLIIGFVIASIGAVITAITLPGKLISKSVERDLENRASGTAYTVRNSSGYEETAYSDNGRDFYGSDGRYIGHKD